MDLNFKEICRICLQSHEQSFDIYTSFDSKRNALYCEMICSCTNLKPYEGDNLPRLICKSCSRLLKRAYSFNMKCINGDKKLRTFLEKPETKSEIVELCDKLEIDYDKTIDYKTEEVKLEESDADAKIDIEPTLEEKIEDRLNDNKLNDDIKQEPTYNDDVDDNWDDDDDNILLTEIKSQEKQKVLLVNGEKKRRKKKGTQNKVQETDLAEAVEDSQSEGKLNHQCDVCGKFLSTKSNLKAHKICHTDLRPYTCEVCDATFRGYSALYQHRKVHTGETPYHCEYCSKQFSRRTGLVNHIRIHTREKMFSCDICFKEFVQSAQLSIHMKRHKGEKSFLCQECGKGFPIRSDLKVHQRVHNGEKPYSCVLCPKTFSTSGNLSIHVRIHKKEVRYNCKECQRGFVTCSAYNVHLKRHKGQRDYSCDCGKTFYTSSALKQHKVVHTGEKRYQCKICEKKFSQTSHLSRHFKRDHVKPNMPVPSSEHYKVVVTSDSMAIFEMYNSTDNNHVKCEGT